MPALVKMLWSGVLSVMMRMIGAMATEKFMEWALFYIADKIVESTKTPHDDKWLAEMKKAYNLKKDGA